MQVPYRLLKAFHKIQQRLVRELEKKFSGRDVVIVGNRRILPPPRNGKTASRPRSRTLTAVRREQAGTSLGETQLEPGSRTGRGPGDGVGGWHERPRRPVTRWVQGVSVAQRRWLCNFDISY